jgi:adenylate cyclase
LSFYDTQHHQSLAFRFGYDPATGCLFRVAHCLCLLGYPDQARKKMAGALVRAKELAHPPTLAPTLLFATIHHHCCRDRQAVQEQAQALILLSQEHEFSFFQATGLMFHGWALVEQGKEAEGLAQMQQGLAIHQAIGGVVRFIYLILLTEAYRDTNRSGEGLLVIEELLGRIEKHEERIYEAELHRLKGELTLLLKTDDSRCNVQQEAEQSFLQAIEVAQRQHAKWWELRATTSLARLWQQQGKKEEARQRLAEIYGWFTEGFDTKDLQEAQTLLQALT